MVDGAVQSEPLEGSFENGSQTQNNHFSGFHLDDGVDFEITASPTTHQLLPPTPTPIYF
jgi:hypothetical protein